MNLRPPIPKPENLYQSEHFDFYYNDESFIILQNLSLYLELNYNKNINFFGIDPEQKFKIYLFSDLTTFHKASDKPKDANEYSVGSVKGIDVYVLSPEKSVYDTEDSLVIIEHEFIHALVNYYTNNMKRNDYSIPAWLNEGLAVHLSGQMESLSWNDPMKEAIEKREFLSLENDLFRNHLFTGKAYPFSSVFIEFLIETRGSNYVLRMLDDYKNLNNKVLEEAEELQKEWEFYLIKKYSTI